MSPQTLTPSDFISLPQRSELLPNPAGTRALFTESVYTSESNKTTTSLYVYDLIALQSKLLSQDPQICNAKWTGQGAQIIWTKPVDKYVEVWIGDTKDGLESYKAGKIPLSLTLLDTCVQNDNSLGILLFGSEAEQPVENSSIKKFTSLPVQTFSGYAEGPGATLWYAELHKQELPGTGFKLSANGLVNVLGGTGLKLDPYPAALPFGIPSYSISSDIIVFPAKRSGAYTGGEWSSTLYSVSISSLHTSNSHLVRAIAAPEHSGQCLYPAISPNGGDIAFTKGESKKNPWGSRAIYVIRQGEQHASEIKIASEEGNNAPFEIESMLWSHDGQSLLFCSTYRGRRSLVRISVEGNSVKPEILMSGSGILSVYRLPSERLLITSSTFVCPSEFAIFDNSTSQKTVLDRISLDSYGITDRQISEFCCKGTGNEDVQTWMLKPSFFSKRKQWPLAMFIHGGPFMAWTNSWSLRWNALLLAEQGYVVILPNYGGSTGVSARFRDSVIGHIGDIPTSDLEACMRYVTSNLEYVDTSRMTALGGSIGGYLAFWLAGQLLAKRFKAFVSHAGIFHAPALAGSDVPDPWRLLFGGLDSSPQDIVRAFHEWNPARNFENWSTPMLISVGEKDRRIPFTHGVGAFSALQLRGAVESRLLVFPDEGHFILKPGNTLRWYEAVIDWVNKYSQSDEDGAIDQ